MEFVWNDGGRAACGFVGMAGDCVTRSIAIATGTSYRDVYESLGKDSQKSARNGIPTDVASSYLVQRGWQKTDRFKRAFTPATLPKGPVVVHLSDSDGRSQHFCTVIDHVVHDTWNPADDDDYVVRAMWTTTEVRGETVLPATGPNHKVSREQELTQQEFDKILRRLKALDNTASNDASTEGEKRNALRMMQTLMLRHNLSREDIVEDDNVEHVQFTRMACPVNGRRACNWEKRLADYVAREIFPTVQWYFSPKSHRTIFTFYGPKSDVQNSIALFRELLLTIATSAHLQYGGFVRGSGASYAEGYVAGLPRASTSSPERNDKVVNEGALIQVRTLALHNAAKTWLRKECNISLTTSAGRGRYQHDPSAEFRGKQHGAKHDVTVPSAPKRITLR